MWDVIWEFRRKSCGNGMGIDIPFLWQPCNIHNDVFKVQWSPGNKVTLGTEKNGRISRWPNYETFVYSACVYSVSNEVAGIQELPFSGVPL